ncbi:hypothetical protein DRP43_03910, partial [candidate division TA06 bacterium]
MGAVKMSKKLYTIITFLFIFSFIVISSIGAVTKTPVNNQGKIADYRWMQANQMNMPLTNYSKFGQTIGGDAGLYWPSGFPNETYIYGAGIWIGGLVRNAVDPTRFDTQLTCGYDPNSGAIEFIQGLPPNDDINTNPNERIYFSLDDDWPLQDSTGQDSVLSTLDSYCTYNDYLESKHLVPENKPLNVSVIQQTYCWTGTLKEDIIFFVFNVILDPEADTVHGTFLGVCTDNDIGNESGTNANDLVGFDVARNMAFQWQNDPETGWTHFPGTVAFKFLQGPTSNGVDTIHIYQDPYDTTQIDTIVIGPKDTLGMTSFKIFTLDVDPQGKYAKYQIMSGYNYQTIDPNDIEASYNPFDIDDIGPADKRFLQTAGPFNLIPGDTSKVIYAIFMASDTTELPVKADIAQAIFDGGWLSPGPPDPPKLYAVPDNKKVSLYWENNAEISPDKYTAIASDSTKPSYNPKYRAYDFAGYKVWKSRYPVNDSFTMIAHYDKPDGYEILNQDSLYDIAGDTFVITKAETLGFENGLSYSYRDEDLLYNGITYYYAVTAYDANFEDYTVDTLTGDTTGILPTSYSSALTGNMTSVIPQGNASNYLAPKANMVYVSGNPKFDSIDVVYMKVIPIVDSLIDTTKSYQIHFGPIGKTSDGIKPTYSFAIYNVTDSEYIPADTAGNPLWIDIQTDTVPYADVYPEWKTSSIASIPLKGAVVNMDSIIVKPAQNMVLPNESDTIRIDTIIVDITIDTIIDTTVVPPDTTMDTTNVDTSISPVYSSFVLNDIGVQYNTENLYLVDSVYIAYPKIRRHPYYNGGSYRITWHPVYIDSLTDSALTCDVYDIVNGIEIPYSGLWETSWRFGKVSSETDQGQYAFVSSSTGNNWKWMYVAGTMMLFNYHPEMAVPPQRVQPMIQANKPVEGEEWYIYTESYPTPSSGNVFNISFTKGVFDTIVTDSLLKLVSVVPNPYLVRNYIESSANIPKMMFTNLPDSCNIFIYTLTGDLVDIIEHKDASG